MSVEQIRVKVKRCWAETPDIRALDLQAYEGFKLPPWQAGDHIDVVLPAGDLRQYSLYNHPHDTEIYRIAVKKEPLSRGGSVYLHLINEGDVLTISPPRNNFPLIVDGAPQVLMAGGIGITPIFAMAQQLAAIKADFELHYFAKSPSDAAFFKQITESPLRERAVFHFGGDPVETEARLADALAGRAAGAHLYFCGPTPFMQIISRLAAANQWPSENLHWEYFSPPVEEAGTTDERPRPFMLCLASTQQEFLVPADKSALEVLRENGVSVEYSCQQGTCGSCIVKVLEGIPEHHDHFLSEFHRKSGKKVALCISRAQSDRLVIDL